MSVVLKEVRSALLCERGKKKGERVSGVHKRRLFFLPASRSSLSFGLFGFFRSLAARKKGDSQNREKQKSKRISRAGGEGSEEVLEVLAARRRAVIDFDEKRQELSFIIETNTRRARNIDISSGLRTLSSRLK